jgi:hypothetical protein
MHLCRALFKPPKADETNKIKHSFTHTHALRERERERERDLEAGSEAHMHTTDSETHAKHSGCTDRDLLAYKVQRLRATARLPALVYAHVTHPA